MLFDVDGRKFNVIKYREGVIEKRLHLRGEFFKRYILLCNAWHNRLSPLYHCPQLSARFSDVMRCNEAVFSTLLDDEINI